MLKDMTRSRVIQVWFVAVALIAVATFALGWAISMGTAGLLLALSLVPPAILILLWPQVQLPTAAEVLRGDPRA
jgi:hypothetical protein